VLYVSGGANDSPKIARSRRVNVDYAKDWIHAELRYFDPNSEAVTKHPKPLKRAPPADDAAPRA
jgi:hypothetical protein